MLVGAVAAVDDGHGGELAGQARRAFLGMTHHHRVGVGADDLDGVRQGFAFLGAGVAPVGEADDAAAQPLHRGLEGQTGAGGGLEETAPHQLVFQQVVARLLFQAGCRGHHQLQFLAAEVRYGNDVFAVEGVGHGRVLSILAL